MDHRMRDGFYAGDLLSFAKAGVRNTAIAITETATPEVREALARQLNQGIELHARIFTYMYSHGLYPAYNPERTIQGDFARAQAVLHMPTETTRF